MIIYLALTQLLKEKLGSWNETQGFVMSMAWVGGFGLFLLLLGWYLSVNPNFGIIDL